MYYVSWMPAAACEILHLSNDLFTTVYAGHFFLLESFLMGIRFMSFPIVVQLRCLSDSVKFRIIWRIYSVLLEKDS